MQATQHTRAEVVFTDFALRLTGCTEGARALLGPAARQPGQPLTEALPVFVGLEDDLRALRDQPGHTLTIERVRFGVDGDAGAWYDLHVSLHPDRRSGLIVSLVDVSEQTAKDRTVQQQRNELRLLSQQLALAQRELAYLLRHFVPGDVAQTLIDSRKLPALGPEDYRTVTVVFADMRNSTKMAEGKPPAVVLETLNTYLDLLGGAFTAHGGALIQYAGDLVMTTFNAPTDQPDHVERGLRAALAARDAIAAHNAASGSEIAFGFGVHTGEVVTGYLGSHQRYQYSVVGDATNVAFHLCALAQPQQVITSHTTRALAGPQWVARSLGATQLKRRREPVELFDVQRLQEPVA